MLCVDHTVSTTVSCIGPLFDSLFVLRLGNGVLQGRGHEGEYQPMSSDFPLSLVNHLAYYAYQYNAYGSIAIGMYETRVFVMWFLRNYASLSYTPLVQTNRLYSSLPLAK